MYAIRDDSVFLVKYEFIRMPDSTGFGDYTESGQVIPVSFRGEKGGYVHAMYLDCDPPIAGGRELWGFPKKLASPMLKVEKDTLGGVLRFGRCRSPWRPWGSSTGRWTTTRRARRWSAELPAEDHSARRWHAAHLRTRALFLRRGHRQGRLDRTGRAGTVPPRARAGRGAAGARSALCNPHRVRPDAGPGHRRLRLPRT